MSNGTRLEEEFQKFRLYFLNYEPINISGTIYRIFNIIILLFILIFLFKKKYDKEIL